MSKVLVVGSFNQDHVWVAEELPQPGATRRGRYLSGPGGKGFNQAVASARSGATTSLLVALGADAAAENARSLAAMFGIDLVEHVRADLATGSAGIFVDARGRNVILVAPGANAALAADFIELERERIHAARLVLAQLEVNLDAVRRALRIARAARIRTMLNPAPADGAIDGALIALADLLTPNETELAALCQRLLGEHVDGEAIATLPSPDLHALCRRLHGGTVIVTLGSAGCFVSHADPQAYADSAPFYRVPAIRANAIDTTGAGDAFNGALAAELARNPNQPLSSALRYAIAYAGMSTERRGAALAMPSRHEVEVRLTGLS